MAKLNLAPRELVGKKVKNIRAEGNSPVALYGPKYSAQNFSVNEREFKKTFADVGYSKLFDVEIEGGEKEKVLVKEVQIHPVTDQVLSVSLYVIDKNTPITTEVPIVLIGLAPAQDLGVGFAGQSLDTLAIKCLPADLPSHIEVSIENLAAVGDTITVGQIKLPQGVELDSNVDATTSVVSVFGDQKELVEEEVAAAPELDAEGNPIPVAEGAEGAEGETAEGEKGEEKKEE